MFKEIRKFGLAGERKEHQAGSNSDLNCTTVSHHVPVISYVIAVASRST